MDRTIVIAASAVAVGLLLFTTSKAKAALQPPSSSKMVDDLARMLIVETGFKHSEDEMAQIVFAAINRSRSWGASVSDVVYGPKVGSARLAWNSSSSYRSLFDSADERAAWEPARAFVRRVLAGGYQNRGYKNFVHPGAARFGFPCDQSLPQVEDGRWSATYVPGYGTRCVPTWAHGGTVVGKALFS